MNKLNSYRYAYLVNNIHTNYEAVGWDMLFTSKNDLEGIYQKIINKKMTVSPKNPIKDFCYNITDNNNWVLRYAMATGREDIVKFALSKGAKMTSVGLYEMEETTPEIRKLLS